MNKFELVSNYSPSGDQPKAIQELIEGINRGDKHQILLGVTGSGKTFTISNVIAQVQKPTLVLSHNKTLAAQLYSEFKNYFPNNAVEFFISYYDYYQPEAYIPSSDTYIEKDFMINEEIDRLRIKATSSLVDDRRDVIVVASVSCIYGIGSRESFVSGIFKLKIGQRISRKAFLLRLQQMFFSRNDFEFTRGSYRVRGDVIDVIPAFEDVRAIRIELFGDEIDSISYINALTGEFLEKTNTAVIFPAKMFVTTENQLNQGMQSIRDELKERLKELRSEDKLVEAQRLEQRTMFDLEMMKEVGYCSGVENYSMHLSGRSFGETPACLFDYFPDDFLLIIDESHVSIPQLRAMYNGDRMRKTTLVEHGFRLPSALENRPLKFDEFEKKVNQAIFMSATPSDYELEQTQGAIVEQVIRPTGLLDPEISVRPVKNQIDDLLKEIRIREKKKQRVLVTTLTKRMAEDLADYFKNLNVRVAYIHSDVKTMDRVEIIRKLRMGDFDVLVGVNLLREGLDLPEVSLVAILDADKEGFLRSDRSLLQIAGRTARNSEGLVILYGDKITKSMQVLIDETNRRRKLQIEYNKENHINPKTVYKSLEEIISSTGIADINSAKIKKMEELEARRALKSAEPVAKYLTKEKREELIEQMQAEMKKAAQELDFERAAEIRDEINRLILAEKLEKEKK